MDSIRVSISVVSHGQGGLVSSLLEDISANVGTPVEVIVTLNRPEGLPFAAERFVFPVRIQTNTVSKGFAANHNAAFRISRGEHFCVLNPDIRIARDPFPQLLACLQDKTVGVAAPVIRDPTGAIEDSARHFPTPLSILRKAVLRRREVEYPVGGATFYPDWV